MIAVIDYGAGNLLSVRKALDFIGAENIVTADKAQIEAADAVILPGVGAFGDAMACLHTSGLLETVKAAALSDTPFLGICLGLQMLFQNIEETAGVEGLSVLEGEVRRFPSDMGLKIPQIGWNSIEITPDCPLFCGVPNGAYVYFVHSYYLNAKHPENVAATAHYGIDFHAAAYDAKKNLYATQFHPEKSGAVGLQILKNFAAMQKGVC